MPVDIILSGNNEDKPINETNPLWLKKPSEVTEEEYERLTTAMESGEDFCDCEEVKDIYDRICDIVDEIATADLLAYNEDIKEKYGTNPDFKASDLYSIFVQFLEEDEDI